MIVSCGHDENGKYRGGKAGDQTGTEYYKRSWYKPSYGWDCVLRYPVATVGVYIASIAEKAAANNNIGYDQNERLTFYNALKAANWHPENISTKCESDCSASTAATVIAAGHQMGMVALKNVSPSLTTYNMRSALKAAGFEVLTDKKYLTSDAYLKAGDIILSDKHHVIVNLTDGASASASDNTGGSKVAQYAGTVNVNTYLNVRYGPGTSYYKVKLDGTEMRLPKGMVVSIDKEQDGWGELTGTSYWVSLSYIKKG